MSVWSAALLGLVQGISEFLPISSSGHLSIISNLFNLTAYESGRQLFNVLINVASLISLIVVFWQDLVQMFYEALGLLNLGPLTGQRRERYPYARLFMMLIAATLPMILIVPIRDMLKALSSHEIFVGMLLILTGCILYVADKMTNGKRTENTMRISDALIIGLCQCVSAIPGLSRTATTITAGLATGLRRDFAVRFSLLMCIPVLFADIIFSLSGVFSTGLEWAVVPGLLVGMAIALLAGIVSINFLRYISVKGRFGGFAYYCWVVGVLAIVMSIIF